ncbi:MAG: primosomal protein N', partial [Maricaulaceae bacterium]
MADFSTDLLGEELPEANRPALSGLKARVLFPLPLPEPFDYAIPEGLEVRPGDHVAAPISGTLRRGVVWAVEPDDGDRDLKLVEERLFAPPLPKVSRDFIDRVARYTCHPPGMVMRMSVRGSTAWKPPPVEVAYRPTGERPAKLTAARTKVLEATETGAGTASQLARRAGVSAGVVRGLADAGVLTAFERAVDGPYDEPDTFLQGVDLTESQANAARELRALLEQGGFQAALLDGVTGSGKTEVYFEAIADALGRDPSAQVLILLPEIALTQAIMGRFEARFGAKPAEWHSNISDAERRRAWRETAEGRARIVVGARSALFLPFANLKLIVVDEEHDGSYKQEDGVMYHARDMAVLRAKLGDAAIVLASATPSIETVVNARKGRYAHIVLPGRPGVSVLPEIDTIDLRVDRPERDHWISSPLIEATHEVLNRGEQALFFLNRRGYAPLVICRACGHRMKAPDTDTWLVEHRYTNRLVCHVTGFSIPKPKACPECKAEDSLHAVGPGVERLEEEARETFPEARIEVFSSDTATDPEKLRATIAKMETGETDILIGTQIVAKGHNFPNLTLVGVVDADLGLKGGDLRAAERTYQTLVQVAGRAGRADKPGRALLQTCQPDHEALIALCNGDRDAFLDLEIEGRRITELPPYGRLAALHMTGPDEDKLEAAAREAGQLAPLTEGVEVMGPAEPPITVVRGRWRRRFLVRADLGVDISAYMAAWRARLKSPGGLRISIDIEPYSF